MIFLTVGTYPLPFERLIKAIDAEIINGHVDDEVFAQIGECPYKPSSMKYVNMLPKEEFDRKFHEASAIISHAGIGTIQMALDDDKPLLVMPRSKKYGEVVNDHQLATARKFEELGHVVAAYDVDGLREGIRKLKDFKPQKRDVDPQLVGEKIGRFLTSLIKS